jgi:hypothetical protein
VRHFPKEKEEFVTTNTIEAELSSLREQLIALTRREELRENKDRKTFRGSLIVTLIFFLATGYQTVVGDYRLAGQFFSMGIPLLFLAIAFQPSGRWIGRGGTTRS